MSKKINYEEGPMDEVKVIADFLPPPAELAFREETVKVTIALSRASVDFFKHEAGKHRVSDPKMIRRLLVEYALHHSA